jgi:hypothetical protein
MDPHSDVKADVDYQAVLSHMNIHKGKNVSFVLLLLFSFFSDEILHNNEASSNIGRSNVHGVSNEANDQDRASIGCNYNIIK